mmetsp:Transcript_44367/g.79604  ORF Transcript_44367/g.79604 Transcript_44367/m.79604 type:complete len:576 (-) Transcript_44367:1244-2971(-)
MMNLGWQMSSSSLLMPHHHALLLLLMRVLTSVSRRGSMMHGMVRIGHHWRPPWILVESRRQTRRMTLVRRSFARRALMMGGILFSLPLNAATARSSWRSTNGMGLSLGSGRMTKTGMTKTTAAALGRGSPTLCLSRGQCLLLLLLRIILTRVAVHGRIPRISRRRTPSSSRSTGHGTHGLPLFKLGCSLPPLGSSGRSTAGSTRSLTLPLRGASMRPPAAPWPRPPRRSRRRRRGMLLLSMLSGLSVISRRAGIARRRTTSTSSSTWHGTHGRIAGIRPHGRIPWVTLGHTLGPSSLLLMMRLTTMRDRHPSAVVGTHGHIGIGHVHVESPLLLPRRTAARAAPRLRHSLTGYHCIERTVQLPTTLRHSSQGTPRRSSHLLNLITLGSPIRIDGWQLRHCRHRVKIRLLPQIPRFLSWGRPPHVIDHVGIPPQKMLVVVRTPIRTLPSHPLESPSVHLTNETLVPRLCKVLWADLLHEIILVEHLPTPAVGHPGNSMVEVRIAEDVIELHGEDSFGPGSGEVIVRVEGGLGIVFVVRAAVQHHAAWRARSVGGGMGNFLRAAARSRWGSGDDWCR